jgi:hypothetical protein
MPARSTTDVADRKAYLLRIDPQLWEDLERLANAELRSVNGQIEYLLREALERRGMSTRRPEKRPKR